MAESKSKYYPEFRSYKPNKAGNGAATKFQIRAGPNQNNQERVMLFVQSAMQTGVGEDENASFGWKDESKTLTIKLGVNDVGEILSVIYGVKQQAGSEKGLYHQNDKGNSTLQFSFNEKWGYNFRVTSKQDGVLKEVKHAISFAEAEVLRVLLTDFIRLTYQWR